ncbi:MAG TPA: DUF2231 domain-containing protein [Longimicrobiaceae bacterium]|nr:DUF2231 domain-containing protein [Longimicrobiaceae bacterium]
MTMRLQEIHPALVHMPIALLPTSLGADALGLLTGSRSLLEMGRRTMPLAAASALVAGIFGFIAQETVRAEGEAHDQLVTHRNLNVSLVALTALMARSRTRRRRPSMGYLAVGLAGLGTMSYSAYLGGKMVYEHGVGVEAAGGVRTDLAPEVRPDNLDEVTDLAVRHLGRGVSHTVEHLARGGPVVPTLTRAAPPENALP